jgi:hypothetical protein
VRTKIILFTALLTIAAGCGSEIGDSCILDRDCSPSGDRICAIGVDLPGGYCTIYGCDYDTCPDEAVCVRFFAVGETNLSCDPVTEGISSNACSPDELCTLGGSCVPRAGEIRYCMKTCGDDGDCRDDYHCRSKELMVQYGGEPVPPPGQRSGSSVTKFCAAVPFEG